MSSASLDSRVKDLVISLKQVLDAHECNLKSFCSHGVQVEGWLKGEFLSFLDKQRAQDAIASFDREEKVSSDKRKKVDFKIGLTTENGTESAWMEIKHWLIGYQKGVLFDLGNNCSNSYLSLNSRPSFHS